MGEEWENIGKTSIFGISKSHFLRPFFAPKNIKTVIKCLKEPLNVSKISSHHFILHHTQKHSVLCILPKPYFHCSRSGRCSKCCQKVHLQVRKPLISCSFSLSWMYQTTLVHARFQPPIVSKLPPKTRKWPCGNFFFSFSQKKNVFLQTEQNQ